MQQRPQQHRHKLYVCRIATYECASYPHAQPIRYVSAQWLPLRQRAPVAAMASMPKGATSPAAAGAGASCGVRHVLMCVTATTTTPFLARVEGEVCLDISIC
jgi:hypothetical protein